MEDNDEGKIICQSSIEYETEKIYFVGVIVGQ